MEVIRGLHNFRPQHRGCVATIGNFDGVHLGHQAVIGQLAEEAAELHLPATLISFEPQPQEYFAPDKVPPRLTRFREKVVALRRFALERMVCLRFDATLAALEPDEFIQRVLVDGLGVRYLVVGDDFRFGKARQGDFASLQRAGEEHGFEVVNMHTFLVDGERVSSTRVRYALAQGDLVMAERLLGRPYRMSGRVAHGDKRGRTIGFPTANIHLHRRASPLQGVFAVEMFGLSGQPIPGVANIGNRPTVGGTKTLLEVHLFDFDRDIYGCHVQVSFVHKLRSEMRFGSFDELRQQIQLDVQRAREFFAQHYHRA
ncbi:MAG: FMN adenylyltransferase [Gammaproteobacteria bacterium SG8_47]|nr:MAG: FMN adenylyltransferase [Gammaproteobacteria bacterium SG8_47]